MENQLINSSAHFAKHDNSVWLYLRLHRNAVMVKFHLGCSARPTEAWESDSSALFSDEFESTDMLVITGFVLGSTTDQRRLQHHRSGIFGAIGLAGDRVLDTWNSFVAGAEPRESQSVREG